MNKIINENNLKNRYYHLQDLSEEDLISLYQVSDVYLMPSLYE
jgi:glycosyltransferase involved in cell wall biosynthesis